jgi:murein L,D-transpeptidase YafK
VLLLKGERRLLLMGGETLLASYDVALGSSPVGPKERLGDGRTPEGRYEIDWKLEDSDYHRAMHVSYPDAADRARARTAGVDPGGGIMIHGLPNGLGGIGADHRSGDWTDGCIAVTNEEMDQIWMLIPDGTPIDIVP